MGKKRKEETDDVLDMADETGLDVVTRDNKPATRDPDYQVEPDPILTMSECARRANKHPSTIARWIQDGLLKPTRHPTGIPGIRESEFRKFYGNSALAAQG